MSQPNTDLHSNRRYKTALMVAVLLFLATLTVTILVILIANAREEDRETEFSTDADGGIGSYRPDERLPAP